MIAENTNITRTEMDPVSRKLNEKVMELEECRGSRTES
jgi:hypothetical protein